MTERVIHKTTPEEAARLDALAAEIESHKEEIIARLEREDLASQEDSLSGQLRRAIDASLIGPEELANAAGIDLDTFLAFQVGDAELSLKVFERLARRLGMAVVMQPIVLQPA